MRDLPNQDVSGESLLPLVATGLTYTLDDGTRLIDALDLSLDAGKLTVIMGSNGAGKSLLLRLLHGLIEPTGGTIRYAGQPLDAGVRKRQALVFQRPILLRRSVAANVDFVLGLKGGRNPERRNELLARVGLADHADQPARSLSGGEQQRLALARALATQPEMLLLDEPTASLDPASTLMIEQMAQEANSAGIKVIFVTHDVAQGRRLADEVVLLERGRVAEVTPAKQFFAAPQSNAGQAYLAGRLEY